MGTPRNKLVAEEWEGGKQARALVAKPEIREDGRGVRDRLARERAACLRRAHAECGNVCADVNQTALLAGLQTYF